MNCLTKLFQQKRRRIGYILAFSGPMISKRDSSDKLEEFLIDLIKNEFPEDNKELDISNSYVDYQLAYRLLNCSLEFKKS